MILLFIFMVGGCSQPTAEDEFLSQHHFLNIAHRGASGHAPEHTLPSYKIGEKMVSDYIEIDLQMTKDGRLIAMHDTNVARTTDGKGKVRDLTLEEIKNLDAGSWFNQKYPASAKPVFSNTRIPTLSEIFDTFGKDVNYYIEIKSPELYPGMVQELISALNEHNLTGKDVPKGKVIIQSFSNSALKEIHQLNETIPLIQLVRHQVDDADMTQKTLDQISEYAIGIGVNRKFLTKKYVHKVLDSGLLLHAFTVNDKKNMKQLINWGATGIFTNYPDRLNNVLKKMDKQ
ncbi:glycerophosphodiester phosphodiesterase [Virgibacillus siamensis]|uniref:glycerophosphodiester phosphodiesterase n=1 Tax=Virgibacillus siamensis TaxID=480071 RepID=UPI001FE68D74|nr:glycerophosphodiester phosphodiesterase [Virgibacillus siamensis]